MRLKTATAVLLALAATGFAQEHMADTLRNGIVEEESKNNADSAIRQYESVMAQFTAARETAATALFHMAECYRKQGKATQAVASYQQLVREFPDQSRLVGQSDVVLRSTYGMTAASAADPVKLAAKPMGGPAQGLDKTVQARARYRASLEDEIVLTQKQLAPFQRRPGIGKRIETANTNPSSVQLEEKLSHLKHDLAALDAGGAVPKPR